MVYIEQETSEQQFIPTAGLFVSTSFASSKGFAILYDAALSLARQLHTKSSSEKMTFAVLAQATLLALLLTVTNISDVGAQKIINKTRIPTSTPTLQPESTPIPSIESEFTQESYLELLTYKNLADALSQPQILPAFEAAGVDLQAVLQKKQLFTATTWDRSLFFILGEEDLTVGTDAIADFSRSSAKILDSGSTLQISSVKDLSEILFSVTLPKGQRFKPIEAGAAPLVKADEMGNVIAVEGLEIEGLENQSKSTPTDGRSVIIFRRQTVPGIKTNEPTTKDGEVLKEMLQSSSYEHFIIPQNSKMLVNNGMVLVVPSGKVSEESFKVTVLDPDLDVSVAAGSDGLPLVGTHDLYFDVRDFLVNKTIIDLPEGVELDWKTVEINNLEFGSPMQLYEFDQPNNRQPAFGLNFPVEIVFTVEGKQYLATTLLSGYSELFRPGNAESRRLYINSYLNNNYEPNIDAITVSLPSGEPIPPTPTATATPVLTESEKVEAIELKIQKDAAASATWELIKYAAQNTEMTVGLNNYSLASAYNVLLQNGGDWEQALPNYQLGGTAEFIVFDTEAGDFKGFFGTISWVAEGMGGYFVIAQNADAYEFTDETKNFLENSPVPLVGASTIMPAVESMAGFVLNNAEFYSESFAKLVKSGKIATQDGLLEASPLFASSDQLALQNPETAGGKRLYAFIKSLNDAKEAEGKPQVLQITIDDYTLDTILAHPYLADIFDQTEMKITVAASSAGIPVIVAQAPFTFDDSKYHINVDEAVAWNKSSIYGLLYRMKNLPGTFNYTENGKTYTIGE